MSHQQPPLEVASLVRVADFYRRRLESAPEDMTARLSLAWCLFLQSIYRAGQESVLEEATTGDGITGAEPSTARPAGLEPHARQLLCDSLRETFATLQLSAHPGHVTDAEKLQTLVRLAGGGKALSEVEAGALEVLERLAQDLNDHRGGKEKRPSE
jgi:hypothetical protein